MVRMNFRDGSFDHCLPDELQSSFNALLFREKQILNARTVLTTTDNSKREPPLKKSFFSAQPKHTANVDDTDLSGCQAGHSRRIITLLVLTRSKGLRQVLSCYFDSAGRILSTSFTFEMVK